jgi:TorA maturation chaperone TorD
VHSSDESTEQIALSLDRARAYRALAQLFRVPDVESLRDARERTLPELCQALFRLAADAELVDTARDLCDLLAEAEAEKLRLGYLAAFDESSGTRCTPTEMDQLGGPPQLELTRTFEMADVAGFYKAFGVEISPGGERADHIAAELEFMHLVAVKESVALQEEGPGEHAEICRDASRAFLRDHLVRWAPRLGECLARADGDPVYSIAGRLLGAFIAFDAQLIDAEGAPAHRPSIEDCEEPLESL